MFDHVVHCDWSLWARGRWAAMGRLDRAGHWHASGPRPVADLEAFVADLLGLAAQGRVLAAFDFPLGLPAGFGAGTGYADFISTLDALGRGEWPAFFDVAATPAEVGPRRPFYPQRPGGTRLRHLLDGHGVGTIGDLMRACEKAGPAGPSAGCMFWTLGAKQVGKAMLHGWRHVIVPARHAGARLWPFDGDLERLSTQGLVLAESYPGDAYGQLGLSFRGKGKRHKTDRASFADHLTEAARRIDIVVDPGLRGALHAGFPQESGGDDGFDATIGLFAAIAVAQGRQPASPPATEAMRLWEGWILGKTAAP